MMRVYKYKLEVTAEQTIEVPDGTRFLHVAEQYNTPCVWALVDDDAAVTKATLVTAGTGHDLPYGLDMLRYLGSYQLNSGMFVGHVFELAESDD